MKPAVLWAFPLLFLVVTGVVYGAWVGWSNQCGGNIACTGPSSSGIPTSNSLFDILNGLWKQMFSSVEDLSSTGTFDITIPFFGIDTYYVALPSFCLPNPLTGACFNVNLGFISFPFLDITTYTVPLAIGVFIIQLLGGILMTAFGIGVGTEWVSINDQGSKMLQTMGIGILIWNFAGLFAGIWLYTIPHGLGIFLMGFLELMFIVGLYWQSQSSM